MVYNMRTKSKQPKEPTERMQIILPASQKAELAKKARKYKVSSSTLLRFYLTAGLEQT